MDLLFVPPLRLYLTVYGTVTLHVAFFPLLVFAVITAVPPLIAFIVPLVVTVATFLLFDEYVTVLFVALLGVIVATSVYVFPFWIVLLVALSFTDVGWISFIINETFVSPV